MAKDKKGAPDWSTLRLLGKTFVVVAKQGYQERVLAEQITKEGGRVVDDVTEKTNYVVLHNPRGTPAVVKTAEKLNKKGANIGIVDTAGLNAMLVISPDDAMAMLRAGKAGQERFKALADSPASTASRLGSATYARNKIDLSGGDLHDIRAMPNLCFYEVNLDGANFRGANLGEVLFGEISRADFTGANLKKARLGDLADCTIRDADLTESDFNPTTFTRCDFSGSTFHKASGYYSAWKDCQCKGVDFRQATLPDSKFAGNDFTGADFTDARLTDCDFTGEKLSKAKFVKADLSRTKMAGADLSGADLREANLADVDLSNAKVDGADFTGAHIAGANLTRVDAAKAKGLSADRADIGTAGPKVMELAAIARKSKSLSFHADFDSANGCIAVDIDADGRGNARANYKLFPVGEDIQYIEGEGKDIAECMLRAKSRWGHGTLRLDEFTASASGCPLSSAELKELVIDAWCETMEVDRAKLAIEQEKELAANRDQWLARMRQAGGVKAWNNADSVERWRTGSFAGADLSGATLDGIVLNQLKLEGATFAKASLKKARIHRCDCKRVSFAGANLTGAELDSSRLNSADFSSADLAGTILRHSVLANATFADADLKTAKLKHADLCAADLSGAKLTGALLDGAEFDEKTQFPAGFRIPARMIWRGKGKRPTTYRAAKAAKSPKAATVKAAKSPAVAKPAAPPRVMSTSAKGSRTFDEFMERLNKKVDSSKREKAVSMLKADRFRLFAEVDDAHVAGIVQSQTNPELVYFCRLQCNGSYACCSQNLNICGGLRGGLCKHLLVLIIGLAKSGQLDPGLADAWAGASRSRNPELDKSVMGELALRFKSAGAGEVDWRPTETVPEDYYAL